MQVHQLSKQGCIKAHILYIKKMCTHPFENGVLSYCIFLMEGMTLITALIFFTLWMIYCYWRLQVDSKDRATSVFIHTTSIYHASTLVPRPSIRSSWWITSPLVGSGDVIHPQLGIVGLGTRLLCHVHVYF